MPNNNTPIITAEAEQVARAVRNWLNTYPDKPARMVDVEYLGENAGLTISTVQAAYKTKQYICGGYRAQYQFSILYREIPTTANERLEMDEVLNNYAAWAESTAPELPTGCEFIRVNRNTNAALLGREANGAEVHQILFTLLYEVNV